MNQSLSQWQFLGPILAAVVAGIVTFLVTVLSKEQKTSEFRQSWIDNLRNEISEFVSLNLAFQEAVLIKTSHDVTRREMGEYLLADRYEDMVKIEASRAKILLRLNPTENSKLIDLLNAVYGRTRPKSIHDGRSQLDIIADLIKESQLVLKQEWARVKRGEPIFRATKRISFVVVVVSIGAVAMHLRGYYIVAYAT